MCTRDFREAHHRRIVLPADSPKDLAAIVEYLYMDDFSTLGNPDARENKDGKECARELASLYVTAEKYQLDGLKELVVEKSRRYADVERPGSWLATAEFVYASVPSRDRIYPAYLRSLVVDALKAAGKDNKDVMRVLDGCMEKGGKLAVDVNRACMEYWREKGEGAARKIKEVRGEEVWEHDENHWRCRRCYLKRYQTRNSIEEIVKGFEVVGDDAGEEDGVEEEEVD
ncbi:MAG: hypothetical protein L6R39_007437 [Caloplaca ligustica]|nr:MAG: hypothetical protein L6R39_007437 [Caloplaca ligustica]